MTDAAVTNPTLDEVLDPVARAKLAGIQETVTDVDRLLLSVRKSIDEKRGVIAAADAITKRVIDECAPIAKEVDAEKMDKEEGRHRIETIQKIAKMVRTIAEENKRDLVNLQGQVVGLEKVTKVATERFNGENMKYQRWQRMQAEEAEEAEEKETPSVVVDEEKVKSKAKPTKTATKDNKARRPGG
jgi:hypothetical protein